MQRSTFALLSLATLALAACVDTTGLSADSSRPARGNPDAGVVVTEFGDFQCPACRATHELVNKPLLEKYGKKIKFVFKHFPLRSIHQYAFDAAQASECAADQGKFWEFVDLNYQKQDQLSRNALQEWAKELNLDMDLFGRCVDSGIKRKTILADYDEGTKAGVTGTPTYFVNGVKSPNSMEDLTKAIDAAIKGGGMKL